MRIQKRRLCRWSTCNRRCVFERRVYQSPGHVVIHFEIVTVALECVQRSKVCAQDLEIGRADSCVGCFQSRHESSMCGQFLGVASTAAVVSRSCVAVLHQYGLQKQASFGTTQRLHQLPLRGAFRAGGGRVDWSWTGHCHPEFGRCSCRPHGLQQDRIFRDGRKQGAGHHATGRMFGSVNGIVWIVRTRTNCRGKHTISTLKHAV